MFLIPSLALGLIAAVMGLFALYRRWKGLFEAYRATVWTIYGLLAIVTLWFSPTPGGFALVAAGAVVAFALDLVGQFVIPIYLHVFTFLDERAARRAAEAESLDAMRNNISKMLESVGRPPVPDPIKDSQAISSPTLR